MPGDCKGGLKNIAILIWNVVTIGAIFPVPEDES